MNNIIFSGSTHAATVPSSGNVKALRYFGLKGNVAEIIELGDIQSHIYVRSAMQSQVLSIKK